MSTVKVGSRRGSRTITARQRASFLAHLEKSMNVTAAARSSGFDRATAYRLRENDEEFRADWEHSIGTALDTLHEVAMDLATVGDGDYIVTKDGEVVMNPDDPGEPLRNRKRDSRMIMFLMTHYMPGTFRPATAVSVSVIPADLLPDPPPTPDEPGPEKIIA